MGSRTFIGRRIGPWLLDRAIERAFARGVERLLLNTNTLDHPRALATYRKFYPGRSENIEKAHVVVWALDPWASACERTSYAPGQLSKFWPVLIEPHGRIHFAGAYADNLNWGMEAATRSANRVAEAIDRES